MSIATIPEIIEEIKQGNMVIITDDENRENEGDLLMAAEFVTAEKINFMITHARGLVCLPLDSDIVEHFNLPLMTSNNQAQYKTNFTVSIEARENITTGISAQDRATTILTTVAENADPNDIVQPGHIFPLKAEKGGVLVRAGHTEAGVDLSKLAGLRPASVICEVMKEDGTMARMPDLLKFANKHQIKIGTIADLIAYRNLHETLIEEIKVEKISTPWGAFIQHAYQDKLSGDVHLALVKGQIDHSKETLVRVHDHFSAMDFINTNPCHSVPLPLALQKIQETDSAGVIVLLHRVDDKSTLRDRVIAETPETKTFWDSKSYGIGAQILASLGVQKMNVLGTASSYIGLTGFGLELVSFVN